MRGKEHCTMNLHLHGHLSACVEDFGTLYSYWLFSYERKNGILGSYHTNNHSISVKLMQKFFNRKMYAVHNWPEEFCEEYFPSLEKCDYSKGSLAQTTFETMNGSTSLHPLPPVKNCTCLEDHIAFLRLWNCFRYGRILLIDRQCKALRVPNTVIGSLNSHYSKSSLVLACKVSVDFWLAEIVYFAKVVMEQTSAETHWVAVANWYEQHQCKLWFGMPTQLWCVSQEIQDTH